jgi:hypothetical protein
LRLQDPLRRYHRDEPPDADADPAPLHATNLWPERNRMRERLASADGKAKYKLRKQTVEPVFGQIKVIASAPPVPSPRSGRGPG